MSAALKVIAVDAVEVERTVPPVTRPSTIVLPDVVKAPANTVAPDTFKEGR